jgi:hypothetical protein
MTPPAVTIAHGRRRTRLAGGRRYARGTGAVIALVLSAADVLMSALTGWPQIGRTARHLGRAVADAWHRGARTIPPARITIAKDTPDDH